MFPIQIDKELKLDLIHPSFSSKYFDIVSKQKSYLSQWLVWPPLATSESFFDAYIQKTLAQYKQGKTLVCAIIYNHEIIGNISFNSINADLKTAEMGYWISKDFQGKGIITRSALALFEIGFNNLQLNQINIFVATQNFSSQHVCKRLNMKKVGIIKNAEVINEQSLDHIHYKINKDS